MVHLLCSLSAVDAIYGRSYPGYPADGKMLRLRGGRRYNSRELGKREIQLVSLKLDKRGLSRGLFLF